MESAAVSADSACLRPVIIFGDFEPWVPVGSIELRYEDLAALRIELAVEHYERTGNAWDAAETT